MGKRYSLVLTLIISLFLLLYVMLSYYSRLATDDYYFIWDVQRTGIWQSLYSHYMEWSGRFSAGLMADIMYKYFGLKQAYYTFFPLISLGLIIIGVYNVLANLSTYFMHAVSKQLLIFSSLLFTALFFFLSFDIGESWFWYCSLFTYLWSILIFIWGVSFLFSSRSNLITYPLIALSFFYIGGASEFNSAIFCLMFLTLFLVQWKKNRNFSELLKQGINKKLFVAFVALGISFLILLIAPGNYLRDELFPKHQFFYSFFIVAKSIVKFCIFYLPFKLPYIAAFSLPFCILGNQLSKNIFMKIPFEVFFKKITIGLLSFLLIFWFLVAYVMVEAGPPRVLILVSFLLTIYFSSSCFMLGFTNKLSIKQFRVIKPLTLIIGFLMLTFHLINQFNIARTYSRAQDERIQTITSLNKTLKKDSLIYLAPLPPCGMLYSAEITADTNHFTNRELRIGYHLNYHVASKKN